MHKLLQNKKVIGLLTLPGITLFTFAVFLPILLSICFGMTDYTGMGKPNYIGLENFRKLLLTDKTFYKSLFHSLILGVALVVLQHPICLGAAIVLDKIGGTAEKIFRAIFFVPCVISIVVTTKMWVCMYDPQFGLINRVLEAIGMQGLKQEWLGSAALVLPSLIFVIMWQGFGWGMLIYYAGVKGLPEEVYEASALDGANRFQTLMHITLPLLSPVITINVTLAFISAFKQMETIYLATNGGPGDKSQFLANYLYKKAFSAGDYGYGNAISVFFVIACLLVTFSLNKIFKKEKVEY